MTTPHCQLIPTGPKTAKATYVHTGPDKADAPLPKLPSAATQKQVLYTTGLAQKAVGQATLPLGGHQTVMNHVLDLLSQLFGDIARQSASAEPRVPRSPVAQPGNKALPNKTGRGPVPVNDSTRRTTGVVLGLILFPHGKLFIACCFVATTQPAQAKATPPASSVHIEELIDRTPSVVKRPAVQPLIEDLSDEETPLKETHVEQRSVEVSAAERLVEKHRVEERQAQELRQADAHSIEEHHQRIDDQRAEHGASDAADQIVQPQPAAQAGVTSPEESAPPATMATPFTDNTAQQYLRELQLANTYDQCLVDATENRRLAEKDHNEAQRHFEESQRAAHEADRKQFQAQQWRHPAASDADVAKAAQLEQEAQRYRDLALQHTQNSLHRVAASQDHLNQARLADQQAQYAQQLLQRPEAAATPA